MATRVQNVQNGQKNDHFRLSPLCSVELKPKTWQNVPPRGFSRTTPPRGPKPTPRSPWARPAARELAYRAGPTGTLPHSKKLQICGVELKPKTQQNVPPRGVSLTSPPRGPKQTPRSPWARSAVRELAYRAGPTGTLPHSDKRQICGVELKPKTQQNVPPRGVSLTSPPRGPKQTPRSPWTRSAVRELAYRAGPTGTLPHSDKRQICGVELKPKTQQNVPPRGVSLTSPPRGPKQTPRSPWARSAVRELAYRAGPTGTLPHSDKRQICGVELKPKTQQNVPPRGVSLTSPPRGPKQTPRSPWTRSAVRELAYRAGPTGTLPHSDKRQICGVELKPKTQQNVPPRGVSLTSPPRGPKQTPRSPWTRSAVRELAYRAGPTGTLPHSDKRQICGVELKPKTQQNVPPRGASLTSPPRGPKQTPRSPWTRSAVRELAYRAGPTGTLPHSDKRQICGVELKPKTQQNVPPRGVSLTSPPRGPKQTPRSPWTRSAVRELAYRAGPTGTLPHSDKRQICTSRDAVQSKL